MSHLQTFRFCWSILEDRFQLMTITGEQHEVLLCRELFTRMSAGYTKACRVEKATDGEYLFHVELLYKNQSFFSAVFIRDSMLISGESLRIDNTTFCTFAFVKPNNTSAVVASSTTALFD